MGCLLFYTQRNLATQKDANFLCRNLNCSPEEKQSQGGVQKVLKVLMRNLVYILVTK